MSKQNEILATIEEFLKDRKGPDFQVSLQSDLRKDLQADSVELMEFIINLEDEYQIEIPYNISRIRIKRTEKKIIQNNL